MIRMVLVFTLVLVFPLCPLAASAGQTQSDPSKSFAAIVKGLDEKSGKELGVFIYDFYGRLEQTNLTDAQIDLLIERLRPIQSSDSYLHNPNSPYQQMPQMPPYYLNRNAANEAINALKYQKVLNGIRKLPMRERVETIIARVGKGGSFNDELSDSRSAEELVRCGKDAVPYILLHQSESPEARRIMVVALQKLRDPRGADFIIDCLRSDPKQDGADLLHQRAAEVLTSFQSEKVIHALVEALSDNAVRIVRHSGPYGKDEIHTHLEFPAKLYNVQFAASKSLIAVTGQNWGLLFNEDPVTWRAWLAAKDRKGFNPNRVKRTPEDLKALVRAMFDRYMSGRPSPESYSSINDLARPEGIAALARDLASLGSGVVPLIESEVRTRCAADPVWTELLNRWTKKILLLLPWPESLACVERLEKTYGTIDLKKDMKKTKGRFDNGESV